MKIKSIFNIIQGHQITDEELYQVRGNYPVLTGRNEIKGYWNQTIIKRSDLPCITYPTKANSGEAYVQHELFDANNTAVLIPFPEWRHKLNLEWVTFKISSIFLEIATSKEGVSYLNKEIIEDEEIDVPDKPIQDREVKALTRLLTIKTQSEEILNRIKKIESVTFLNEYKQYQAKDVPANKFLYALSGNSGLTEEYIYTISQIKSHKKFKLLTGSIDINKAPFIALCRNPKNSKDNITTYSGEGIHVVRKGKAGHVNYLPCGDYTLNDDAYILTLKPDCNYDISLEWLSTAYQTAFFEFASKSDNGTWNKNSFFKHAYFDIPSRKEQDRIAAKFAILKTLEKKLSILNHKVISLLSKKLS